MVCSEFAGKSSAPVTTAIFAKKKTCWCTELDAITLFSAFLDETGIVGLAALNALAKQTLQEQTLFKHLARTGNEILSENLKPILRFHLKQDIPVRRYSESSLPVQQQ